MAESRPPATNVLAFGIGLNADIEFPEVAAKWLDFLYSEYGAAWTHLRSPEGWTGSTPVGSPGRSNGRRSASPRSSAGLPPLAEKEASYDTYERGFRLFQLFHGAFPTLQAQLGPVVEEWEQRSVLGRSSVDSDWGDYMTALSRRATEKQGYLWKH